IVLYGPDGAILKTEDGSSSVKVAPEEIRQKSKAVYLEADDIFLNGKIHLNGPIVQDKAQMKDTTASLIGPLKVEKDAVINGVSASGHSHDVTGVQSGNSTITSKKPNPG
ncbi:TPA: phage baseplate protein, partial [Escherichia coli]|nr:phage baseplate protein [Escherichia coli]